MGLPQLKTQNIFNFLPGDIIFGIVTVVGQSAKEKRLAPHHRECVPQSRARVRSHLGLLGFEPLPFPPAGLQLVQLVGVFAVLHHAAEDEEPGAIAHKAVGGATWWDVAPHCRDKPLVSS